MTRALVGYRWDKLPGDPVVRFGSAQSALAAASHAWDWPADVERVSVKQANDFNGWYALATCDDGLRYLVPATRR